MWPALVSALGTAYVRSGRVMEGRGRLQDALDRRAYKKAGNYTFFYLLVAAAEAEAATGHSDVAAGRAEHAEHLARVNGERAHLAQALHLRAHILAPHDAGVAERLFVEARTAAERCLMRPLIADCWLGLAAVARLTDPSRSAHAAEVAAALLHELGLDGHVRWGHAGVPRHADSTPRA